MSISERRRMTAASPAATQIHTGGRISGRRSDEKRVEQDTRRNDARQWRVELRCGPETAVSREQHEDHGIVSLMDQRYRQSGELQVGGAVRDTTIRELRLPRRHFRVCATVFPGAYHLSHFATVGRTRGKRNASLGECQHGDQRESEAAYKSSIHANGRRHSICNSVRTSLSK
jgi:hypothetical protein